jgi:hypothetical protein
MSAPRVITAAERAARKKGLGDHVQSAIHAGLDASPISAATRKAIKGCAGCQKRVGWLNRAGRAVASLFSTKPKNPTTKNHGHIHPPKSPSEG